MTPFEFVGPEATYGSLLLYFTSSVHTDTSLHQSADLIIIQITCIIIYFRVTSENASLDQPSASDSARVRMEQGAFRA